MAKILVYASGYPRPAHFTTDREEIRCGLAKANGGDPECVWSPSLIDFEAIENSQGAKHSAKNPSDLMKIIRGQPVASIEELRILGHGTSSSVAFGGEIHREGLWFDDETFLGDQADVSKKEEPAMRELYDRFAKGAKITVASCHSGGGERSLLRYLCRNFVLPVHGFKDEIDFKDGRRPDMFDTKGMLKPQVTISKRGGMRYPPVDEAQTDPLFSAKPYTWDAYGLTPDASATPVDENKIVAAMMRHAQRGDSRAAFFIGWQLLNEFFPVESGLIPGVGFDETGTGLSVSLPSQKVHPNGVIESRAGFGINVSVEFMKHLTPDTLHWRVGELGKVVKLATQRTPGTIPLQK